MVYALDNVKCAFKCPSWLRSTMMMGEYSAELHAVFCWHPRISLYSDWSLRIIYCTDDGTKYYHNLL